MSILYDEENKTFTLLTKNTTYQMLVDSYGVLLHLYYGRRTEGALDYLLTYYDRGFSGNPYDAGNNRGYSLDVLPQEFPCMGTGDYRSSALTIKNSDGSYSCDLRYEKHEIKKGKYRLPGLPAVYASNEEADTLEITLSDRISGVRVILLYGVLPERDILTRSVKIINDGENNICLEKVASACLDFTAGNFDCITFYGRHAMERIMQRAAVSHGNYIIQSKRGTSSHQYNPLIILAEQEATEKYGDCYALSYVYSGGFQGETEQDQFGQTRVLMGLQEALFSYPLKPGESFYAPEVILSFTHLGLNQLSSQLHTCLRKHICRGRFRDEVRPVLINSWEASYFSFTGDTIYALAKEAAECGIEMLVLDDGWFGNRNDDNSSLGDWVVNEKKMGCPLHDLIERINGLGLRFGIWMEPEMVSEESDLYRTHPDWALKIPGRNPVRARNQLVLNLANKEVTDYLYRCICDILHQGNIEYVKWDMNRSITDVYSAYTEEQGTVLYDYILGLYDLLERLVTAFPNVLFEGCSGGGGRFDAGMLYYTPQIWCSDNTDAIDRVQIQYGTSFGYPASMISSHVSAVPNHQTGRSTPMHTRGVVAMYGAFGYELNLGNLTDEEKQEIKEQIAAYHKYAPLIQNGLYYRLSNPLTDTIGAWAFIDEQAEHALLNVVMLKKHGSMPVQYVRLQGLLPNAFYREIQNGRIYQGSALMQTGIPLPLEYGTYQAYQYYFERVSRSAE